MADMVVVESDDSQAKQPDDEEPQTCAYDWFWPKDLDENGQAEWENNKQPYILHPDCKMRRYWELLSMICIVYSCITIPYRLAFGVEILMETYPKQWFCDKAGDSIFIIDFFMTLRLATWEAIGGETVIVTKPPRIAVLYAKSGWMFLDFTSSFPFDQVLELRGTCGGSATRILKVIRIFRMVKILRMVRIKRLLKKLQDDMGIKNGIMISIKFVIFVVFVSHFQACLWFSMSDYNPTGNWALGYCIKADHEHWDPGCGNVNNILTCREQCTLEMGGGWSNGTYKEIQEPTEISDGVFEGGDVWTPKTVAPAGSCSVVVVLYYKDCVNTCMTDWSKESGNKFSEQYAAAFYWSIVTLTTLGYGDITPANHDERLFCVYAMLMGASIFAYSVTNMCTLVYNLNPAEVYFRTRKDELNDYLEFLHIPKSLRQRVEDFYKFKVERSEVVVYNESLIMKDMSKTMQEDVKYFILSELINMVPFFEEDSPVVGGKRFLAAVAVRLESAPMAPLETIVKEGDIATKMYLISRGVVKCTSTNSDFGEQDLVDGSIFGASALFRPSMYGFTASVVEYVDMYTLSKYEFDEVLEIFNRDKTEFEKIAIAEGLTESREDAADAAAAAPLMDLKKDIEELRTQITLQTAYIKVLTTPQAAD